MTIAQRIGQISANIESATRAREYIAIVKSLLAGRGKADEEVLARDEMVRQEREAAKVKAAESPFRNRLNALESRINRLEARGSGFNSLPKDFWADLAKEIREFVEKKYAVLAQKIKDLEDRPELKYHGVWVAGRTYAQNSLATRDGSLWIAKRATAAYPCGGAEPDSWQLCVKRGADGKDAK